MHMCALAEFFSVERIKTSALVSAVYVLLAAQTKTEAVVNIVCRGCCSFICILVSQRLKKGPGKAIRWRF